MDAILSTSAAVCHVLAQGPRYGRDIIRFLNARARGTVNPRPGTIYRAFESLVVKGLVRRWTVVPGGRRGARARKYYELTPRGILAAQRQREVLTQFLGLTVPSMVEPELMAERIGRTAQVSAFTRKLELGVRKASRRRS